MTDSQELKHAMTGRWLDMFQSVGIDVPHSNMKHGPCPACGGTDRFRCDDKEGSGSHICSQCGAGDGFSLLQKVFGYSFPDALAAVQRYLGHAEPIEQAVKPSTLPEYSQARQEKINRLWRESERMGWPMAKYFRNRGLNALAGNVPPALRFCPVLPYWETIPVNNRKLTGNQDAHSTDRWECTGHYPAILGAVTDQNGSLVSLHRTYITDSGQKAPVGSVKKLMAPARPGALKGCGIKLGQPGEVLYLTEGIETGLSIMLSTGEAVWSCMSAHLLEQVQIPPGVKQVRIMADKDVSQTGERSAWILAERLLFEDSDRWVEVCTPPMDIPPGQKSVDWLDVFNKTNEEAAA